MAKLTDKELRALLDAEKQDALSAVDSSDLSDERTRAMEYYLGDMSADMEAPTDRSKAISSDVSDTIEGLMPSLMEIFASGDEVVMFDPVGPEDEELAQQETDYVNHVFLQKNAGFLVLYSFIKDALLSKVGVVKVLWEEGVKEDRQTYVDMDDDSYALLMSDPDIEIVEHSEREIDEPAEDAKPETEDAYAA